jgi:hypothetical protein
MRALQGNSANPEKRVLKHFFLIFVISMVHGSYLE